MASNNFEAASLFSEYFASVFQSLSRSCSLNNSYNRPYSLPSNCFFSPDDVFSAFNKLIYVSSNGTDGLSTHLLFQCRSSLFFPLFTLFRKCMNEGFFPSVWKICSVTPVLKTIHPYLVFNYRPISIPLYIA